MKNVHLFPGYVRYMHDRREELRKESPDMHHLDVTKKIGEEWMTLGEERKQPYLDAAKQDKTRYFTLNDAKNCLQHLHLSIRIDAMHRNEWFTVIQCYYIWRQL